jgi:hypothetical protein
MINNILLRTLEHVRRLPVRRNGSNKVEVEGQQDVFVRRSSPVPRSLR